MDTQVVSHYLPQKESCTIILFTCPSLYTDAFFSEGWLLESQATDFQILDFGIPYTWSNNSYIFISLNIATLMLPNACNNSYFIQQCLSKKMTLLLTK